jgi:hypothetical protein
VRRISGGPRPLQRRVITTVVGTGTEGFGGDGGPATSALLNYPYGLTLDGAGNLYIADGQNGRIRKVTPAGVISTIAGSPGGQVVEGGEAGMAGLQLRLGVTIDGVGNLYIAETGGHRVRKVANVLPSASFKATPRGLVVTFDASPRPTQTGRSSTTPGSSATARRARARRRATPFRRQGASRRSSPSETTRARRQASSGRLRLRRPLLSYHHHRHLLLRQSRPRPARGPARSEARLAATSSPARRGGTSSAAWAETTFLTAAVGRISSRAAPAMTS